MKRENLIHLRKERQMTQVNVADKLDISENQYQRLEAGTSNGSIEVWEQLKHILGAPSLDFLIHKQ